MRKDKKYAFGGRGLGTFLLIAYGVPAVLTIFLAIAKHNGADNGAFPYAWMFLPACGVFEARLRDPERKRMLPMGFCIPFLGTGILLVVLSVMSAFIPSKGWETAANILVILSSIACLTGLLVTSPERRAANGLSFGGNWKRGIAGSLLFLGCYALVNLLGSAFSVLWTETAWEEALRGYSVDFMGILALITLPLNFVLSFSAFFGEEYGWRCFLQPILQERFGMRKGVLCLGLIWGLWHLPLNLFYYSPQTGWMSFLVQVAACTGLGIFFGWVYLRTQNVWAVTLLHFLNNNLAAVFSASGYEDVVWDWASVWIAVISYLAVFLPFLAAKEYRMCERNRVAST